MPKGEDSNSIKNEKQYAALRDQGMSKEKAARIANAGKGASKKGGKNPKYEDWTKDDLLKRPERWVLKNVLKWIKKN